MISPPSQCQQQSRKPLFNCIHCVQSIGRCRHACDVVTPLRPKKESKTHQLGQGSDKIWETEGSTARTRHGIVMSARRRHRRRHEDHNGAKIDEKRPQRKESGWKEAVGGAVTRETSAQCEVRGLNETWKFMSNSIGSQE